MADEIRNQNLVTISAVGKHWRATIGPDTSMGLSALGTSPAAALANLASAMSCYGWVCDPDWFPRVNFTDSDA